MKKNFPVITAFDLETTGLDAENDSIIELGIFKFTLNDKCEAVPLSEYSQLIDPQTDLPVEVELLTGIKSEELKGQPNIKEIFSRNIAVKTSKKTRNDSQLPLKLKFQKHTAETISGASPADLLTSSDYILGHNVGFDISFLSKHINLNSPALDSQVLAETYFPGLSSYSLDVLPYELNIDRGQAHRALDDTKASVGVFAKAVQQFLSLTTNEQDTILDLYLRTDLAEGKLLTEIRNSINRKFVKWQPTQKPALELHPIKELADSVSKQLISGKTSIITHTARPVSAETVALAGIQTVPSIDEAIFIAVKNEEGKKRYNSSSSRP